MNGATRFCIVEPVRAVHSLAQPLPMRREAPAGFGAREIKYEILCDLPQRTQRAMSVWA